MKMGQQGTTITLNGTNFIGISDVIFPGNIPGTNLLVTSVNQLTVTVPAGITTTDSLRLTGVLGTAASPQLFDSYITHPSPGYLCNFEDQYSSDNTGFVGWTGGYADAPTTTANLSGRNRWLRSITAIQPDVSKRWPYVAGKSRLVAVKSFPMGFEYKPVNK